MNTFRNRFQAHALESHPVRDGLTLVFSLLIAVSVDLTRYPEMPAVIAYQVLLLTAAAAIGHLAFIKHRKNKLS